MPSDSDPESDKEICSSWKHKKEKDDQIQIIVDDFKKRYSEQYSMMQFRIWAECILWWNTTLLVLCLVVLEVPILVIRRVAVIQSMSVAISQLASALAPQPTIATSSVKLIVHPNATNNLVK